MSTLKNRRKAIMLAVTAAFVCLALGVVGCSPAATSSSAGSQDSTTGSMSDGTQVAAEGAFVSDEQCLSCHGGTYEAVGALLADRGDWNPHDSIHGGYATCVNCHSADKVTDRNYCTYCHAYMPE